jgi:hypothetical protein
VIAKFTFAAVLQSFGRDGDHRRCHVVLPLLSRSQRNPPRGLDPIVHVFREIADHPGGNSDERRAEAAMSPILDAAFGNFQKVGDLSLVEQCSLCGCLLPHDEKVGATDGGKNWAGGTLTHFDPKFFEIYPWRCEARGTSATSTLTTLCF